MYVVVFGERPIRWFSVTRSGIEIRDRIEDPTSRSIHRKDKAMHPRSHDREDAILQLAPARMRRIFRLRLVYGAEYELCLDGTSGVDTARLSIVNRRYDGARVAGPTYEKHVVMCRRS
ncbi:hypothetical protein EVAR_102273_1 [Eumeta japonica]|uniref:Uncharacterized protein n=1 Tax=Eumeta variegata TaxID=151549 RepID=A0A4C1WJL9_EUMVA|nr:hypothetical protein EVAR_102273_1 [Eumeta japonica]